MQLVQRLGRRVVDEHRVQDPVGFLAAAVAPQLDDELLDLGAQVRLVAQDADRVKVGGGRLARRMVADWEAIARRSLGAEAEAAAVVRIRELLDGEAGAQETAPTA